MSLTQHTRVPRRPELSLPEMSHLEAPPPPNFLMILAESPKHCCALEVLGDLAVVT